MGDSKDRSDSERALEVLPDTSVVAWDPLVKEAGLDQLDSTSGMSKLFSPSTTFCTTSPRIMCGGSGTHREPCVKPSLVATGGIATLWARR